MMPSMSTKEPTPLELLIRFGQLRSLAIYLVNTDDGPHQDSSPVHHGMAVISEFPIRNDPIQVVLPWSFKSAILSGGLLLYSSVCRRGKLILDF